MLPVTLPVFLCGIVTCVLVEKFQICGYGARLPENVRRILVEFDNEERKRRTNLDYAKLIVQALSLLSG